MERMGLGTKPTDVWHVDSSVGWWGQKVRVPVRDLPASHISPGILPQSRQCQPTPVLLPGESQGWGSPVGCRLWDRTESDTTEVT